jgi:hypothetical protein
MWGYGMMFEMKLAATLKMSELQLIPKCSSRYQLGSYLSYETRMNLINILRNA